MQKNLRKKTKKALTRYISCDIINSVKGRYKKNPRTERGNICAKKEYLKEYDKSRAEQKRAAQKARYEAMTAEQREEANHKARENYAKRQLAKKRG